MTDRILIILCLICIASVFFMSFLYLRKESRMESALAHIVFGLAILNSQIKLFLNSYQDNFTISDDGKQIKGSFESELDLGEFLDPEAMSEIIKQMLERIENLDVEE